MLAVKLVTALRRVAVESPETHFLTALPVKSRRVKEMVCPRTTTFLQSFSLTGLRSFYYGHAEQSLLCVYVWCVTQPGCVSDFR